MTSIMPSQSEGWIRMRYEKGHKDATRKRIIAVASQRFREEGVGSVGVATLMAEAGLTHGGFYSHFASKEDLVRDAMVDAQDRTLERVTQAARQGGGVEAIIRGYLNPAHRDNPGHGCVLACLLPELARHPASTRAALTERLERSVALIADYLPDADPTIRRDRAFSILGTLAGNLQLARAVSDPALSDRILASGITAALTLATTPIAPSPETASGDPS
jgi:AcrR family transcriptional regulator